MTWIPFSKRQPVEEEFLITRSPGTCSGGDCFEDWRKWKKEWKLVYRPPTHWWSGPPDFDLAVNSWKSKPEISEESLT